MKTQKVKGIKTLQNMGFHAPSILGVYDHEVTEEELHFHFPRFARPCPKEPQHGFVDSRVVNNIEELNQVIKETLAADPDGEVMVMDFIKNATHNAILTSNMLTVGLGHDGATSGKNCVSFPLVGHKLFSPAYLKAAGIKEGEDAYAEIVNNWWTQLRSGPKVTCLKPDYIPADTKVKAIIQPEGQDLLAWAKVTADIKPGTVVWHPGGSMTDHYAVHARTHKIPILTTIKPEVGMTLVCNTNGKDAYDPIEVLKGVQASQAYQFVGSSDNTNYGLGVELMLMCLHNSAVFTGAHSKWLGVGVGLMLRYGSMALRGEARHVMNENKQRNTVYYAERNKSLSRHARNISKMISIFRYGTPGVHGVGGDRWTYCGTVLRELYLAVQDLAKDPTEEGVGAVLRAFNKAVNVAHNGGWWMNKFAPVQLFSELAKRGLREESIYTIPIIHLIGQASVTSEEALSPAKWMIKRGALLQIKSPSLSWAGSSNLKLSFGVKGTSSVAFTKHLPVSVLYEMFEKLKSKTFIEADDAGLLSLKVDLGSAEPQVLWAEQPLAPPADTVLK